MFGGLCFMVNDKMCVALEQNRMMVRGYVFVDADALYTQKRLDYWIQLALGYNAVAKAAKKKK
jgi:hypothetical protein